MATDNTNSGLSPPAYSANYYSQDPPHYGSGSWSKDGTGNIAVISSMGNMGVPEDRANGVSLPDYNIVVDDLNAFSDASIRRGFVRKVYLTLMIQLLVTVGIICAFLYWNDLRIWAITSNWFTTTMMVATTVLILVLGCCANLRRKVPLNFIFLGLFTIVEGLMLGSVSVYYDAEAVMWAVGATAFVSFTLTVFALQSKWDFTKCTGLLWVLAWSLFSFGMLCAILRRQYLNIVYACVGTTVFSVYLVIDTQLMLGGNHKYSLDPEEYIFAALNLYLDIVTLFLMLLQLIGRCR